MGIRRYWALFTGFTALLAACSALPLREPARAALTPLAPCAEGEVCVAIIGDSTCQGHQPWDQTDREGWGTFVSDFVKKNVRVVNFAVSGFATDNFLDPTDPYFDSLRTKEGDPGKSRFDKVVEFRPTYVLIDLGINDVGHKLPTETFKGNLLTMAKGIQARHGQVIFVPPHAWNAFSKNGELRVDPVVANRNAMTEAASESGSFVADLYRRTFTAYSEAGPAGTSERFMRRTPGSGPDDKDGIHFNAKGAQEAAGFIIDEIRKGGHPLAAYLR